MLFRHLPNALYSELTGQGLYATTGPSAFAFIGLDKFMDKSTRDATANELRNEMKNASLTTMDAAQYKIMTELASDAQVGQLELVLYPGHFSATPPVNGTNYISILTAIMVCSNPDNNWIDPATKCTSSTLGLAALYISHQLTPLLLPILILITWNHPLVSAMTNA